MQAFIETVINKAGYAGVCFLIALENLFPPIPSEVILTLSGFVTKTSELQVLPMVVAATAGSLIGALALYLIGRILSFERITEFVLKHKRVFRIKKESLDKANAFYNRHQTLSVLIFRLVPLMRSLISLPAGANKMNIVSFILLTALGSLIWNAVLILLGAFLGQYSDQILHFFDIYAYVVYAVLGAIVLVGVAVYVVRRIKEKRQAV